MALSQRPQYLGQITDHQSSQFKATCVWEKQDTSMFVSWCGHLQRAQSSGQDFREARMRGKTDGSVTATLKQGHSVYAADTAILRGCIILVQSLHYHTVKGETIFLLNSHRKRDIRFFRSTSSFAMHFL